MTINRDMAHFILRVLDLAKGGWQEVGDTPEMESAAQAIKNRYNELKQTTDWNTAAMTARIEFLMTINDK